MVTILTIIAFLAVLYGVASFIVPKLTKKTSGLPHEKKEGLVLPYGKYALYSAIAFLALTYVVDNTLYKITAQEVGVVITPKGMRKEVLTTGWNFVAPWNTVKRMDKTVWVYTLTSNPKKALKIKMMLSGRQLLTVLKWDLIYQSIGGLPNQAPWIYANIVSDQEGIELGGRYKWIEENIIRPAIKSVMPLTISRYTPIECYSEKRTEIQQKV